MKVKILSWSRKTGIYNDVQYDTITLYGVSPKSTYETDSTVLQGHPIEFHKIPVKVRYWNDVTLIPLTEESLNTLIGKTCNVSFSISSYNGVQSARVDSIDIVEEVKTNA